MGEGQDITRDIDQLRRQRAHRRGHITRLSKRLSGLLATPLGEITLLAANAIA